MAAKEEAEYCPRGMVPVYPQPQVGARRTAGARYLLKSSSRRRKSSRRAAATLINRAGASAARVWPAAGGTSVHRATAPPSRV